MGDIVERLREVLADDLHTPLPWIGAGPSYGQPLPMELTSVVTDTEPDSECDITICRDAVTPDVNLICAAVNAAPVLLAELDRLRAQVAAISAPAEPPPSDPLYDDAYLRGVALGFPQGDSRRWTLCRIADRIEAAAAPAAPAGWQEVQRNAARWLYIAGRWTHADFRWNRDAGNTPKSVTLTVKALPGTGSNGGQLASFIDEAIAAAPGAPQGDA